MNKFAIAAAAFLAFGTLAHAEDLKPCEDALKEMRDAKTAAKLADADMKMVDELEAKGVERCNADERIARAHPLKQPGAPKT